MAQRLGNIFITEFRVGRRVLIENFEMSQTIEHLRYLLPKVHEHLRSQSLLSSLLAIVQCYLITNCLITNARALQAGHKIKKSQLDPGPPCLEYRRTVTDLNFFFFGI